MKTIAVDDLDACYPTPLIRGARIARLGEQYIAAVASDAATCKVLGEDQIGWFIGGVPTFDRMIELVRRVDASREGGRWIIVPATRFHAEIAHQAWFEYTTFASAKTPCTMWHGNQVIFCVPERLGELHAILDEPVAGIILLDPNCTVHRGRGFGNGKHRITHDRPQLIVDFKCQLAIGRWSPPLMIMSVRRAAAVQTEAVSRIYGLEAMHFVDGASIRCGKIWGASQNNNADREQQATLLASN